MSVTREGFCTIEVALAELQAGRMIVLVDDEFRFLACLLLQRDGRFLRGHKRRPKQSFELAIAHEILLQLLDLVGEICALAPNVFEAHGNLVQ